MSPVVRPPTISVCVSCRAAASDDGSKPGEALLAALSERAAARGQAVSLRPVQCLSVCKRPCTVALSADGRYTYLFGDLDPVRDVEELLDGAALYADREHGFLLWRERPKSLRAGIVARLPPLDWSPADGSHPR